MDTGTGEGDLRGHWCKRRLQYLPHPVSDGCVECNTDIVMNTRDKETLVNITVYGK